MLVTLARVTHVLIGMRFVIILRVHSIVTVKKVIRNRAPQIKTAHSQFGASDVLSRAYFSFSIKTDVILVALFLNIFNMLHVTYTYSVIMIWA